MKPRRHIEKIQASLLRHQVQIERLGRERRELILSLYVPDETGKRPQQKALAFQLGLPVHVVSTAVNYERVQAERAALKAEIEEARRNPTRTQIISREMITREAMRLFENSRRDREPVHPYNPADWLPKSMSDAAPFDALRVKRDA